MRNNRLCFFVILGFVAAVLAGWLAWIHFAPHWQGRWGRYAFGGSFGGCKPSMSPDGESIVYASPRSGLGDLYICRRDGSGVTRLTDDPLYEGDPQWSPDGRQIAFVRERYGAGDIWIMDADGANQCQLTNGPEYEHSPCFTRDGTGIVFARAFSRCAASNELYVMKLDGRSQRRLTDDDTTPHLQPSCSPTSDTVAFSLWHDIWLMDGDGKNRRRLTTGSSPDFSPGGTRIVFLNDSVRDYQYEVHILNLGDNTISRITNTGGYKSSPTFCPDGQHILFLHEPTASGVGTMVLFDLEESTVIEVGTTE